MTDSSTICASGTTSDGIIERICLSAARYFYAIRFIVPHRARKESAKRSAVREESSLTIFATRTQNGSAVCSFTSMDDATHDFARYRSSHGEKVHPRRTGTVTKVGKHGRESCTGPATSRSTAFTLPPLEEFPLVMAVGAVDAAVETISPKMPLTVIGGVAFVTVVSAEEEVIEASAIVAGMPFEGLLRELDPILWSACGERANHFWHEHAVCQKRCTSLLAWRFPSEIHSFIFRWTLAEVSTEKYIS